MVAASPVPVAVTVTPVQCGLICDAIGTRLQTYVYPQDRFLSDVCSGSLRTTETIAQLLWTVGDTFPRAGVFRPSALDEKETLHTGVCFRECFLTYTQDSRLWRSDKYFSP